MAYNVSYSTMPTFTTNSIGYTRSTQAFSGAGNTWIQGNQITLDPGIYIATANMSSNSSYNSYAFIVTNNYLIQSMWYDSNAISYYNMSTGFPIYQGSNPSTGGVWNSYVNWVPVAGAHYLGDTGMSYNDTTGIQLSSVLTVTNTTNVNTIAYVSDGGNHLLTLSITRIS